MSIYSHQPMINHHGSGFWAQVEETIHTWRERLRNRRELAQWSERDLHDVGHFPQRHHPRDRKTVLAGLNAAWPAPPRWRGAGQLLFRFRREHAMSTLRLDDLKQYSDVLRARNGDAVTVRFVEPRDAEELQNYFRSLSTRSRYNRFFGAMSELPHNVLDHFIHVGERDEFSVIATMKIDGFETIVGEARYAFHPETETPRIRPVDRRPLAGPGHRLGAAAKPGMPRGGVRRAPPARRYAALQRGHDQPCPQVRLCVCRQPRRLEAGALRQSRSTPQPEDIPCASWRLAATRIAASGVRRLHA